MFERCLKGSVNCINTSQSYYRSLQTFVYFFLFFFCFSHSIVSESVHSFIDNKFIHSCFSISNYFLISPILLALSHFSNNNKNNNHGNSNNNSHKNINNNNLVDVSIAVSIHGGEERPEVAMRLVRMLLVLLEELASASEHRTLPASKLESCHLRCLLERLSCLVGCWLSD